MDNSIKLTQKLQRTGTAISVALPKQWLEDNGLTENSEIEITELLDGSLNVKPSIDRQSRNNVIDGMVHNDHDLLERLRHL